MEEFNDLTDKQKVELINKLVSHAENIDLNFQVILNPNNKHIKKAKENAEYFLKVVKSYIIKNKLSNSKVQE